MNEWKETNERTKGKNEGRNYKKERKKEKELGFNFIALIAYQPPRVI